MIKLGIDREVQGSESFQQVFQKLRLRRNGEGDEFTLPPKKSGFGR
jgi:hypothetical protein